MVIVKHCPNCGSEIADDDIEFCTECGYNLLGRNDDSPVGFFAKLNQKTSFPVIIFSFVIFGIFLFVGSFFWSFFMASGSLDLMTYLMLTIVFSVFFGGIFVGYFGCMDKTYVLPNFTMYLGSIFAVILCGIGLIFTFLMGILSAMSSAFSAINGGSSYGSAVQPTTPNYLPNIDLNGILKIILFILLIPVAAYFGVYVGYFLKENI